MKFYQKTIRLACVLTMFFMLGSCAGVTEKTEINIAVLKGPTGMGAVQLIQQNEEGTSANKYNFTIVSSPEEIVAGISSGEFDIVAAPTNLAAVLYQKMNKEIQMAAINTLGTLYILENGNEIHSISDLKGKTIYATGQGAVPEYALRFILSQNGIDPDNDLIIEYKSEHAELATLAVAGDITLCMLPEPNVTTALSKNDNLRIALNLTEEWESACENAGFESQLTMGCIVVKTEFINANKKAFDVFLNEYEKSIDYINEKIDDAANLVEKYEILPSAAIAKKAIPNSNIVYIDGEDMKEAAVHFFDVLHKENPSAVGGALPDEKLYYSK